MRKILVAVAVLALFLVPTVAHASTQDFTISSFTGDYYLSRASDNVAELKVVEKIVADFPDFDQNHGIERAIPQSYRNHSLELNVQSVTDGSGTDWAYSTSTSNDNKVLRIGNASTYVHGEQTYVITYTMRGVSLNLSDHDEFYWDINGDQWQQYFGQVVAHIHVPANLVSALQDRKACYVGFTHSEETNCISTVADESDGGKLITFNTLNQVTPSETMTTVLAFNNGTFADYSMSPAAIRQLLINVAEFLTLPIAAALFIFIGWRRNGRDARGKGVIVPQYLPPKELSVLASNAVLTEKFASKAISATIIDLAVRHYIKIYEVQKQKMIGSSTDYELELIKLPDSLRDEEQQVVKMLFTVVQIGTKVQLSDLKRTLAQQSQQLGKSVNKQLATDGYFKATPERAQLPYHIASIICYIVGFFLLRTNASLFVGLSLFGTGIILNLGALIMAARTAKGAAMKDYLLGLKMYIKLAEAERLKVLQSPHGELTEKIDINDKIQLIKLYEKLLPYAMLFGLEKDWAREMAGLYQQSPDWYYGSATFNAIWFASSLNAFNTSAATTFAPPSSSGSSGFGGGAGGGGGGGGGGGW
ncbi:MAG TPA: DUF2207 domain-containing protein [Candidatus Saccharimonas sp.]|nr:DUF2207 domain-containing protein [Candidatus Saccharimonas sp.]